MQKSPSLLETSLCVVCSRGKTSSVNGLVCNFICILPNPAMGSVTVAHFSSAGVQNVADSDVTTKLFPNKRSRCYKKREGLVYAECWRSNLAFRTLFGCSESVSVFRTLKARSVVNISRTPEMCSGETERQRSKQHANVHERTLTFKQERLCSIYSDRTPRTRSQSVSSERSILCSQVEHSGLECRTAKFYKRILHSSMPAECY